jgi:hypothetical protein
MAYRLPGSNHEKMVAVSGECVSKEVELHGARRQTPADGVLNFRLNPNKTHDDASWRRNSISGPTQAAL